MAISRAYRARGVDRRARGAELGASGRGLRGALLHQSGHMLPCGLAHETVGAQCGARLPRHDAEVGEVDNAVAVDVEVGVEREVAPKLSGGDGAVAVGVVRRRAGG